MAEFGEDLSFSATSIVVISQHEPHQIDNSVHDVVNPGGDDMDDIPRNTYLQWEAGKNGDLTSDSSVEADEDDQSEKSCSEVASSGATIQQRHVIGALAAGLILGLAVGAFWTRRKMSSRVSRVERELQLLRDELLAFRSGSVRKDMQSIRVFLNDWLVGGNGELFRVGEFKQWRDRLLHMFIPVKLIG